MAESFHFGLALGTPRIGRKKTARKNRAEELRNLSPRVLAVGGFPPPGREDSRDHHFALNSISTRRLAARPLADLLSATGLDVPPSVVVSREASICFFLR